MNKKTKQIIMNINMSQSRFGTFKDCNLGKIGKLSYINNFQINPIDNLCTVLVIDKHPVDIIEFLYKQYTNINPVALCNVNYEFTGYNIIESTDMNDEYYNLRTNFNISVSQNNLYPIKENECIYLQNITVIRDNNFTLLDLQKIFKFSMLVASSISQPELIDDKLNPINYLKLVSQIECLFQTAITFGHNTIILTPFGYDDNIPQSDIIKIYNLCIYKYGHKFKYIIFGILNSKELYDLFNSDIVKPQLITQPLEQQKTDFIDPKLINIFLKQMNNK